MDADSRYPKVTIQVLAMHKKSLEATVDEERDERSETWSWSMT